MTAALRRYPGLIFFFMIQLGSVHGQQLSFSQLDISNGLSDNNVRSLGIDGNGYLWIGTASGLSVYDGYSVSIFQKEQYENLPSDMIEHITVDGKGRVWLGTPEGVAYVDAQRNIHRVLLEDTVKRYRCKTVMETDLLGPVIFSDRGQFYFDTVALKWKKLTWIPEKILGFRNFMDADRFGDNGVLFTTDSLVLVLDFASRKVLFSMPLTSAVSACRVSKDEIAIGIYTGQVIFCEYPSGKVTRQYQLTNALGNRTVNTTLTEVRPAPGGDLVVATGFAGLFVIGRDGHIGRYSHDPVDPTSIASNNVYRVISDPQGNVVVGTANSGLSVCNITRKEASHTSLFYDDKGDFYDGAITGIVQGQGDLLWLGGVDRLIRWNRRTKLSTFYYYYDSLPVTGYQRAEFRAMHADAQGNLWTGILGVGLARLSKGGAQPVLLQRRLGLPSSLARSIILDMTADDEGWLWVTTLRGVYRVNMKTLVVDTLKKDDAQRAFSGKRMNAIYFAKDRKMWMTGAADGLYSYDLASGRMQHWDARTGLLENYGMDVVADSKGNAYVTHLRGFSQVQIDGKVRTFTKGNDLPFDRCESVLLDREEQVWFTNFSALARIDPSRGSFHIYNDNAGIRSQGFRQGSSCLTRENEMYWGTFNGLLQVNAELQEEGAAPFTLSISRVDLRDSAIRLNGSGNFVTNDEKNSVVFHFAAINLKGSKNIRYRYKLEGFDQQWQEGTDIRQARYASLPVGDYVFRVMASADRKNWVHSKNAVDIVIEAPWWRQPWFNVVLALLLLGGLAGYLWYSRRSNEKRLQEQEAEQAIHFFTTGISARATDTEDVLWGVARNCLSHLQLEDAVIYLIDEKRNVLVQKAAIGPKNSVGNTILEPIEIPLGKGITGTVALTGKPELVGDTSKDARYIVDDKRRWSELAVPIIAEGKVIGVIDCEHSKKRFFTQRHLTYLQTIASLCGGKIIEIRAEQEKMETERLLVDTKRKMTDLEMQALRAQMNPHFIFNCLNSINRYIVKSDQATASLYLTRFARLIRLILDNSNSKVISLANELEALRLYIEMESIRFEKQFQYSVETVNGLQPDAISVPPLIIQPFVENAIWHGLLHKEGPGQLRVLVKSKEPGILQYCIEDNGIGRKRSAELKSRSAPARKSLGMKLTEDRLAILNREAGFDASVQVEDLYDNEGHGIGTRVLVTLVVDQ